MFRQVGLKLTLSFVVMFICLYTAVSILIYGVTARLIMGDIDILLQDTARPLGVEVAAALDRGLFPAQFVALTKLASIYPKVSAILLRDAVGDVIANTNMSVSGSLPYHTKKPNPRTVFDAHSHTYYRILTERLANKYGQTEGYLQVAIDVDRDLNSMASLKRALFIVAAAGTLLAALAGLVMSRVSLRPIELSWSRQRQFAADASHELRTPLTVIRLNLEVLRAKSGTRIEENEEWLAVIEREVDRLGRLTQDLLTLARADSDVVSDPEIVDLLSTTRRAITAFAAVAASKGLALRVSADMPEDENAYLLSGDSERLYQLIAILLDNAIKYTASGEIRIDLSRHRHTLQMVVSDTGIGIDPELLPRIFDRFVRGDQARVRNGGGAGLGLAIAQWIVHTHGGRMSVTSEPGAGSSFVIWLPARVVRFA